MWRPCKKLKNRVEPQQEHPEFRVETYLTRDTVSGYVVQIRRGAAHVLWYEHGIYVSEVDAIRFERCWIVGDRSKKISGGGIMSARIILKEEGMMSYVEICESSMVRRDEFDTESLQMDRVVKA